MAREGLKLEIRAAIHDAKRKATTIRREGLQVRQDGQFKEVNVEVIPIKTPAGERYFLILFEDAVTPAGEAEVKIALPAGTKTKPGQRPGKESSQIVRLEREIASTKKYLQSIIEEEETTNEELRAANEEILSSNEEFQSINEELETAREELQSTNEELTTLNEELQNRNAELGQLNNDMINLLGSVDLPVVMLGGDLHIRRFTPAAGIALNLTSTDIERSISDVKLGIDIPDLESLISEVMKTAGIKEREVLNRQGRWYSLRIRPYTTAENRIDGAVLVLVDIDALIRSLEEVKESRDYARAIVETVREPLVVLDKEQRVKTANRSFYRTFQAKPEETENRQIYELGNHQWEIPGLRILLEEILPQKTSFQDFEVEHDFQGIGHRTMLLNARQIKQRGDGSQMILLAIEDITERKAAEKRIRDFNNELLTAQEQERARIAGDIHDSLGASLATIKFRADSLIEESHKSGNDALPSGLDAIMRLVQENIDEVRRLQQNLRPPLLDDLGILSTIEWYCREFQTTYPGIRIGKLIDIKEEEVSQSLKIIIFRILQEALNNVAKHGGADLVDLSLRKTNGMIELSVRDNGQGFDVNGVLSEENSRRGLGLTSMKERAAHSGGTLSIDSVKGKGTVLRASWPME
jgi:two-component system, chemotaxis family, CheB/CheR fusion protein